MARFAARRADRDGRYLKVKSKSRFRHQHNCTDRYSYVDDWKLIYLNIRDFCVLIRRTSGNLFDHLYRFDNISSGGIEAFHPV